MELTKEQKQDLIQQAARKAWNDGGQWGLLAMATGTGKSKIAVDEVKDYYTDNIYLVVPTEKLRDNNWEDEFKKWGAEKEYSSLHRYCYASINKVRGQIIDLVILDEGHSLTELNSQFFLNNSIKRVMVLSATPPDPKGNKTDQEKVQLFKQFRIKTDFYYPLEQARKDGLAPTPEIWIVETNLDNTVKYIEAGNKANRFMQTEQQRYDFLSKIIKQLMISKKSDVVKWKAMERRRLIAGSIAKKNVTKRLIEVASPGNRTLVFGGTIPQIDELLGEYVYHSKAGEKGSQMLERFIAKELDILGCVDALNEGMNLSDLDVGIISQVSSSIRELVQRIGRFRWRPNHIPVIYIVVAVGTVDEDWLAKALEGLGDIKLKYIHAKNI